LGAALTVPHAVAALVLCVAAVAKLRAPRAAADAVGVAPAWIRAFAVIELAVGSWGLLGPGVINCALIATLYVGFALLTLVLWRDHAACGCFGSDHERASPLQSSISATLALVCAVSAAGAPHGAGWILGRPPGTVTILGLGTAAAAYGTVLAYTELALLWRAWSPA
jgi:hypothetical protein